MRESDLVNYLYLEFLAPYAQYRALRVTTLLGLCNLASTLARLAH